MIISVSLKKYDNWLYPISFSLFLSFVIVTVFSFSTSFLFDNPLMYDSAVFQLIGKNWVEGRLPYKDLWELKGPAVFLPSAIGYWLLGSKLGLYLLQIINLAITFFSVFKTYLLEFSKKNATYLTLLSSLYFVTLYEVGNTVEEFLLPLLTLSFYLLYKYVNSYIDEGKCELPGGYAFLFGSVLGYSLMSRLTNAISICIAVSVIMIFLFTKKKWNSIVKTSLCFICGFIVITVPFLLYFYLNDAFDEMWYGTFLFGLEYAGNSGFDILSVFGLRHIILRLANCYFLILISLLILKYNTQRKFAGWMWLFISVFTFISFLRLNPFGHYYMITLPFTSIILIEIHKMWMINKKWMSLLFLCVISIYILLGIMGVVNNSKNYFTIFHDYNNKELAVYERIVEKLPSDYKSSFIAFNCDTEMYLYLDIPPKYPYYTGQPILINCGPSIRTKVEDCFRNGDAKWMVVYGQPSILQDILSEKYNYIFSEKSTRGGVYYVYSKK